jgi:hypothetical protein
MVLATRSGAEIDAGFWGPDISKVQLGELPPITTPQFAGYAAITLAEVIPRLDPTVREELASDVHKARERIEALPTFNFSGRFIAQDARELTSQMDTVGADSKVELMAELCARIVHTPSATSYRESPFKVEGNGQFVRIGANETSHSLSAEDFLGLTLGIMRGGIIGWDEHGTYQEVKNLVVVFDEALAAEYNGVQ